jgi:3-dehydroquinate synthase
MGYVDAAIGIKTGVNFGGCKNRVGSFTPPLATVLDRRFLKTLPERHLLNGIGEIVKLALVRDAALFELLESEGSSAIEDRFQTRGAGILRRAVSGMLEELEPNLFEEQLDRFVDFGHTFSPALEMCDGVDLLHGEAVAIDAGFSVMLAQQRMMLSWAAADRILSSIVRLGLPVTHPFLHPDLLWKSLQERMLHRDRLQRVPLTVAIGRAVFVNDISIAEVSRALAALTDWSAERLPSCRPLPAPVVAAESVA